MSGSMERTSQAAPPTLRSHTALCGEKRMGVLGGSHLNLGNVGVDHKAEPCVHFCKVCLLPTEGHSQGHKGGKKGCGHVVCLFHAKNPAEIIHKDKFPSQSEERACRAGGGSGCSPPPSIVAHCPYRRCPLC